MAGVGKSTTGKRLAQDLGHIYIECDQLITKEATALGLDKETISDAKFINLEEKTVLSLANINKAIIDTGGSVVYSPKAMELLQAISTIVYLHDQADNIRQRFEARGEPHLIGIEGKTFEVLLEERSMLYKQYAAITINASHQRSLDEIIQEIKQKL